MAEREGEGGEGEDEKVDRSRSCYLLYHLSGSGRSGLRQDAGGERSKGGGTGQEPGSAVGADEGRNRIID